MLKNSHRRGGPISLTTALVLSPTSQAVADGERQQHLQRSDNEQDENQREQEARPKPARPSHVAEALAQVGHDRRNAGGTVRRRNFLRPHLHNQQASGGDQVGQAAGEDRDPGRERRHGDAAKRGSSRKLGQRPERPLQAISSEQLVLGEQVRQERGVGWDEECFASPDKRPAHGQVPDPEVAGQREQPEDEQDSGAEQGGGERKLRGAAAQFDHLPGQRDQPQPASDQRDRQSRPQQAEVAVAQGTKGRRHPAQHGYDPTSPNRVARTFLMLLLYPTLYTRPFRLLKDAALARSTLLLLLADHHVLRASRGDAEH